jgi:hypothetical protein
MLIYSMSASVDGFIADRDGGFEWTAPYPVVIGGGTPFLPPVTEPVPLDLIETRTFGSRVIYERYRRVRDDSD